MWSDINSRIRAVLNDYTLSDVLSQIKDSGMKSKATPPCCP